MRTSCHVARPASDFFVQARPARGTKTLTPIPTKITTVAACRETATQDEIISSHSKPPKPLRATASQPSEQEELGESTKRTFRKMQRNRYFLSGTLCKNKSCTSALHIMLKLLFVLRAVAIVCHDCSHLCHFFFNTNVCLLNYRKVFVVALLILSLLLLWCLGSTT